MVAEAEIEMDNAKATTDGADLTNKQEKSVHQEDASIVEYEDAEHEPALHHRTWLALAAMFLFNYATPFAIFGPISVVSYIGTSLNATQQQNWILSAMTLPQAVLTPLLSSVSDVFQIRKPLIVGALIISFVGAAIAPGSETIYRLIGAQVMISFGLSAVALGYAIPSEILPRRWRPMGQVWINTAASLAACTAPISMGALTKSDPINGWRKFWWIEMAIWGISAVGIFVGYRPPKRHTNLDHLTFLQKLRHVDLLGFGLFGIGLTLLLVGLNLGGGQYAWVNARVLAALIIGIVILILFGVYEWKFTSTGILHHALFRRGDGNGRTLAICIWLIFVEGILLFAYVGFYPILTTVLFTQDPFILTARQEPYWVCCLIATPFWGIISTRYRAIRSTLAAAFVIFTAGIVGLATIEPGQDLNALAFAGLAGVGFGGIIINIVAAVQLCTPQSLIATASSITVSSRAIAASVFTAIWVAAFTDRLKSKLPAYVAGAALGAGLPPSSLEAFIVALTGTDPMAVAQVSSVTPAIIGAGVAALKQAYADSLRVVYMIAAPFGIAALVSCYFMADLSSTMSYRVDAPVEALTKRKQGGEQSA